MSEVLHASELGAEWRRWDPHIHAPGTLLNDQFGNDWEGYLERIEQASPTIEAVGVTDYFCIRGYVRARAHKQQGRLPKVKLLFPNVELRLNIETERRKAINLHLLFSPHDGDHVERIEGALATLTCKLRESTFSARLADFERLGKLLDPKQTDQEAAMRAGANAFKVSFDDVRSLFKNEKWVRENCLVAVPGTESDGPSGLQGDPTFAALRQEIESFADIIFSGQAPTRDFWLGRKPGNERGFVERKYRALKPCLHGSDAHRAEQVGQPDQSRYCWLKADLTFEGLRQVVLEPADRAHIGTSSPDATGAFDRIRSVKVEGAAWFPTSAVVFNPGLVAIIGERGSGKTALADIVAAGAGVTVTASEASFLARASSLVAGAKARLEWCDNLSSVTDLEVGSDPFGEEVPSRVRYLSQQFVERLCSGNELGDELLAEVEGVIFQAIDETERLGASSFSELRDSRLASVHEERAGWIQATQHEADLIAEEDALKATQPAEVARATALKTKIEAANKELSTFVSKGEEVRANALAAIEALCKAAEGRIQWLRMRAQRLDELAAETRRVREIDEPRRVAELRRRYPDAGLVDADWAQFGMKYVGDVDVIVRREASRVELALKVATEGDLSKGRTPMPSAAWSLVDLRAAREKSQSELGIEKQKARRFAQVKADVSTWELQLEGVTKQIAQIQGADLRRNAAVQRRRAAYASVFATLASEQKILESLYLPLAKRLRSSQTVAERLEFVVVRHVDLDVWVSRGEELLDLRSAGKFRGHGSLRKVAEGELLPAWESEGSAGVATAMGGFIEKYWDDLRAGTPSTLEPSEYRTWHKDVGAWLASTSHVSLRYALKYGGVDIAKLSPGTRGIVLLVLYLAVDEWDHRPLVIDQPEENLDPRSVFSQLVEFFRGARQRRQVILVTHNANLVVNADVDQVIVASAERAGPNELPVFSYFSGGLENARVRNAVCDLLEGGERAFREREKRYRLK